MKVVSAKDTKKPANSAYDEVEPIMIFERHGRKFAVHPSYNKLISCYMLSEYTTGNVFKAYGVPKMNIKASDIDRCIERAYDYLDSITDDQLEEALKSLPEVNSDDPDVYSEPSYDDIEKGKRNAKIKEEAIKRKFEKKKEPVRNPSTKGKKKRGRPKKKPSTNSNGSMSTLI